LVADDLEALLHSGNEVYVPDGSTVHKYHVFEVLGREDSWDRTRRQRRLVQVSERGVHLVKGFEVASVDVARAQGHSALVAFWEFFEGVIYEGEGGRVVETASFCDAA